MPAPLRLRAHQHRGSRWFPGIDQTTRFATYVAERGGRTTEFAVAFGVASLADLADARRTPLMLSVETVKEQSPDALAISELKAGPDGAITAKLYGSQPAFGTAVNGLPLRHYQAEIHMGNDRELFGDTEGGLPLYEGRMIDQFDHRAKAYRSGRGRAAVWEPLPFGSPDKAIVPQWRVPPPNVPQKAGDRVDQYRVGFGDVARPTTNGLIRGGAASARGHLRAHRADHHDSSEDEWRYLLFLRSPTRSRHGLPDPRRGHPARDVSILDGIADALPSYEGDSPVVGRLAAARPPPHVHLPGDDRLLERDVGARVVRARARR